MDSSSEYVGTRLFNFVELIEARVQAKRQYRDVRFAIGRNELSRNDQLRRVVVVPVLSQMVEETQGNYGTRHKRNEVFIFDETEAKTELLLEAFIRGAVDSGMQVFDLGPERPRTEEDDAAGLTKHKQSKELNL